MARHDREAYKAHYEEDLERRALEIEQKNVGLRHHEEVAYGPVSKEL